MRVIKTLIVAALLLVAAGADAPPERFTLWTGPPIPDDVKQIPEVPGVRHQTIHRATADGYKFLHGASIIEYKGVLYATWANSPTNENGPHETFQGRCSKDGGRTWSDVEKIGPGFDGPERHSHGVLLVHDDRLWAICSRFGVGTPGRRFPGLKAEAFVLDEAGERWQSRGVVMENCWPYDQPARMGNGNWITGGQDKDGLPVVAVSHGDDLTRWDSILIPYPPALAPSFAETTVWPEGRRVLAVIRGGAGVAWVSTSDDYGRTWSEARKSNLPMPRAKAYVGKLSSGQLYLVSNLKDRDTLVISVGRPGVSTLSRMWTIRHGKSEPPRFPGHAKSKQWSYPYAYECDGKLLVVYSIGKEDCGLSVIPIESLQHPSARPLANGPIAHWSFDDVRDGRLADDSGGGHDGRAIGRPEAAPGVEGQCLRLDGSSDYVAVPDADALDFSKVTFSVTAWANVYALGRGQQMIAAKNVYSANQREWGLMLDDDDHFRFYLHHKGWQTIASRTVPQPGRWYHVAVTVDAGLGRLYVNGQLEGEAKLGPSITGTAAPLTIGGVNDGGRLRQMWFGAIDEVCLYGEVLGAEAIGRAADRQTTPHEVPKPVPPYTLWTGAPLPKSADIPVLDGVRFSVIKPHEPKVDGGNWLLGVALAWHKDKLYASYGFNTGSENTPTEEAHVRASDDGGRTWGKVVTIDAGQGDLGVSHGVFLSHGNQLWAFHGAFYGRFQRTHTRAYLLDEATGRWLPKGVVVDRGFWPMQEPLRMDDGNWIMAGARVCNGYKGVQGDLPAVAISHGDDLTRWDLVVIPTAPGVNRVWGESTVIVDGPRILNISRWGGQAKAIASVSTDYGRTWTPSRPSNLLMATSKPYAGTLSTGQNYLVCTTTADSGGRRSPLTIAVTRPGQQAFSRVFVIRHAVFPEGPGPSNPNARLCYPYAIEHDGQLYVGYAVKDCRTAEMAVIPLKALVLPKEAATE